MLKALFIFIASTFMCINSAMANIVITGTRVIYPADQSSIGVDIKNVGVAPSLVQVWLDDGDENANPANLKLPFIVMLPVSRVEPNTSQTIRIRHTGEQLPQDRESLYYFNLQDNLPKPKFEKNEHQNYLQFVLRSRLKFFYRPAQLPYPVQEAYDKVNWYLSGNTLTIDNVTPYYITYSGIELLHQGAIVNDVSHVDMIAPFSQLKITLAQPILADTVSWNVINDYGGHYHHTSPLIRQE